MSNDRPASVIGFAPHPWDDGPWMNRQNLLAGLAARGWRVVYSEGAPDIWQRGTAAWNNAALSSHIELLDGVQVHRKGRFLPRWRGNRHWDALALRHHANQLRRAAAPTLDTPLIAILFHPMFESYLRFLRADIVAFHVYDLYAKMSAWSSADQLQFERLVARADLITAATDAMIRSLPPAGADRATLLPNGGNYVMFADRNDLPCPADLADIAHPRIGNLGTINRKMDLSLIAEIARRRPDWQWVLVGKVEEDEFVTDPERARGLSDCRRLPNVHFLGARDRLTIPAYMNHMDVNTVCYRIREDDYVVAGYPVKLNEYLATGKPVVASPQEATVSYFREVAAVVSGPDQWVDALAAAIDGRGVGGAAQRQAVARANDWSLRIAKLEAMLLQLIAQRQFKARAA